MFDVKRIRERAADWLGDVGAAALFVAGDVLGAVGKAVRGEGDEEAIERGDDSDGELRARVKATLARGEPCPGHHVDFEPCDLCASPPEPAAPRIEVRDGVEWLVGAGRGALPLCGETAAPIGGYPVSCTAHLHGQHIAAGYDHGNGARVYHRWHIEPSAGTSTPASQDPAPHPTGGVQPVDSAPRWKFGPIAGPVDVVKPPHNAATGALGEAHAVGVCSRPRCPEGEKLRAIGRYCPCGAELRPVGVVTPPDPFVIITPEAVGTLGGAALASAFAQFREDIKGEPPGVAAGWTALDPEGPADEPPANLCAIAAEATRATDAQIQDAAQRLAVATGDDPADIASAARKLARHDDRMSAEDVEARIDELVALATGPDRRFRLVKSRLTAGEARRLEAKGWAAGVVWYHDEDETQHEHDGVDLGRLRERAGDSDDPVPADAPPLTCQEHPTELDTSCALCAFPVDRATPPVAGAAERVPEILSGGAGAPWRGLEHEVQAHRSDLDTWVVEAVAHGSEGEIYAAHFSGQHAEARAREYAALMSVRAGTSDAGKDPEIVALRERGFTLSPDLEARAAHVLRGVGEAPAVHEERPVVDTRWGAALEREAKASESYRDPVARRDAAILRAAAKLVRTEEDARLILEALGWINPDAVERVLFGEDEDGEGDAEPALPKPDAVRVGQRWRCVGVDGELVVRWLFGDGVSVRLGPAEDEADGKIVARTAEMLGLKEWSYVGGAR